MPLTESRVERQKGKLARAALEGPAAAAAGRDGMEWFPEVVVDVPGVEGLTRRDEKRSEVQEMEDWEDLGEDMSAAA